LRKKPITRFIKISNQYFVVHLLC